MALCALQRELGCCGSLPRAQATDVSLVKWYYVEESATGKQASNTMTGMWWASRRHNRQNHECWCVLTTQHTNDPNESHILLATVLGRRGVNTTTSALALENHIHFTPQHNRVFRGLTRSSQESFAEAWKKILKQEGEHVNFTAGEFNDDMVVRQVQSP